MAVILHISCRIEIDKKQTVNPVLGDLSFVHKFGHPPGETINEDLRIKTHLGYVENLLRQKPIRGLSPELREKRKQLLNLLHDYHVTGIFPRNYDYKENRQPCFIDKDNRICAVGYLIDKTAGRQVAKDINSKHKYDDILSMNNKIVDSWIETSGFTKEECAMIQPTYGPPPITPRYGISSSVLGGLNLSLNTLNGIQISKGTNNKTIAIVGLISGAGQTILGASMFPKTTNGFNGNTAAERKTLSMVNIGLGTSTMILSAWNLMTNRSPKDKKMTWNLNSFETPDNNIGMGFTLRRKL